MVPPQTINRVMPLQTLSTLHFLVHPFFLGDPTRISDPDPVRQLSLEMVSLTLAQAYVGRASRMNGTDAVIAFSHLSSKELATRSDDFMKFHRSCVTAFEAILGERFFFVPGDHDLGEFRVAGLIAADMRRRGYATGRRTRSIAYGDRFLTSLIGTAANLREAFDLPANTTIDLQLTDAALWWTHAKEPERNAVRAYLHSLSLSLNEG